jgi:GTP pyrophosphokinase
MQEVLTNRFEDALVYATKLHHGQVRKGTQVPYVSHLLAVASLVLEAGGDEDEVIAALLHDGPEDRGGEETLDAIRECFGFKVANIVSGCSDTFEEEKPPWSERKRAYLSHLANAPASVLLVSCADKLHNARAILADYRSVGEDLWERFRGGKDGTLWYYRALVGSYAAASEPPVLLEQLERVVNELEALAST